MRQGNFVSIDRGVSRVTEVCGRIDAGELAAFNERVEQGCDFGAAFASGAVVVFAPENKVA